LSSAGRHGARFSSERQARVTSAAVLSLALKIALAPALVVAATLAARRWGDRVGGIVIAIPIVAGPVLLVLAIDHGRVFVERAATGALLGIVAVCGFCLSFDRATAWGVVAAVTASWLTYAALAVPLARVQAPPFAGLLVALSAIAATQAVMRRPPPAAGTALGPLEPPAWDLWARAGATLVLVVALTTAAGALGPGLSGVLTPFPVATTVVAAFTAAQAGRVPAHHALRGYLTGLPGFAAFFVVVALIAR
jgi:hypothetical protein